MITEPGRFGGVDPRVADRGPTALRIAVGAQLRALREQCGITREAAGDYIRGSHAKISRLELGRTGFKERDILDLLTLYGVMDPDQRAILVDLARGANQPGWWHSYNDLLPSWFETYLGLEGAAQTIRTFEGQLVPGLLQTDEYTHAVIAVSHHNAEATRRVELRRRRREILDIENGPALWAVLDEAVLHRPIGGRSVLRNQIRHLVTMSDKRNVTIQVLPYQAGGHPAAGSSFTMLRFTERELPDIVYLEQLTSALYLDRREDLQLYREVMDRLAVQAEQPDRSRELLIAAAEAL
ncbi:helix-turn-helix domain-containing protein [Nocardia brasiliensis]|uniref:helix-turn-helix domain-containing protein n=1 Tax=Nocardia brasiliensis TaxID=37326 RepID=UPI0004A729F4|nr:helix-turn-helix transcriptional regulator [Nocardia brasiliensis]MBF6126078.1 helix-turn-helix domain-containing protein [Nocardia brasiliensis]MBF6542913.1 helix-turn-helix domain-containing protein [Nocardia brasiliensis]